MNRRVLANEGVSRSISFFRCAPVFPATVCHGLPNPVAGLLSPNLLNGRFGVPRCPKRGHVAGSGMDRCANSAFPRRGPEGESFPPKSGASLGKRTLFWRTEFTLVAAGETETGGRRASKVAERGVETEDAGSLCSRRRVVTAGLAGSLPIVRLPEPNPLRTPLQRVSRSLIQQVNVIIELAAI
jgi:hypothetical protein